MDDLQAMLSAYQTGELDVAIGLPDYIALAYAGSDELFIWNMLTSKFLLPNLNVEVLQDARIREAIAIGINRTEICAVIGSDYIPTTSYVAEFMLSNASSEYFSKEQPRCLSRMWTRRSSCWRRRSRRSSSRTWASPLS